MRRGALGAALLLALAPSLAGAQSVRPDRWNLARDPGAARVEKMIEQASDRLDDADSQRNHSLRQQAAAEARSLLEQLGGSRATEPRVRYLYGHSLHILDDDSGVIAALGPLLGVAFDHPLGVHVMFDLAVSYAKVERFREEIEVYDRLLTATDRAGLRNTILSNRGESRAKIDDFAGSVADFRKTIDSEPMNALARWGLAVTLDRWGDLSGAMIEGGFAWDLDHEGASMLDRSGVFFVPGYDKWWYHALRQLSAAQKTLAVAEKVAHLQAADRYYELYLAQAPSTERWVPLARARRQMVEARLVTLRKQLPKGAKGKKPGGEAPSE